MKTKTAGFEIKALKPEIDIEEVPILMLCPRKYAKTNFITKYEYIEHSKELMEAEMKKDLQAMDIVAVVSLILIVVMAVFM